MRDGEPLSWRHFLYGHRHLARAHAREALRAAGAASAAQAKEEDRKGWFQEQKSAAGW